MAEADEASEHDLVGKRSATMPQSSTQVSLFVFSVVARMVEPSVGTMMDGEHVFATNGGTAWRRRQRRLRAFRRFVLWHSKMEIAAVLHHTSRQRTSTTAAATQTSNFAPVLAAATYAATASFSAPATRFTCPFASSDRTRLCYTS